jgi:hypothetical protein
MATPPAMQDQGTKSGQGGSVSLSVISSLPDLIFYPPPTATFEAFLFRIIHTFRAPFKEKF